MKKKNKKCIAYKSIHWNCYENKRTVYTALRDDDDGLCCDSVCDAMK